MFYPVLVRIGTWLKARGVPDDLADLADELLKRQELFIWVEAGRIHVELDLPFWPVVHFDNTPPAE